MVSQMIRERGRRITKGSTWLKLILTDENSLNFLTVNFSWISFDSKLISNLPHITGSSSVGKSA